MVVDPAGVVLGLWEGHRAGAVLVDEPGGLGGFSLRTPDLPASTRVLAALGGRVADGRLWCEGTAVASVAAATGPDAGWVPGFVASDLAGTVVDAVSQGARIVRRGADGGVTLRDPWGATFRVLARGAVLAA